MVKAPIYTIKGTKLKDFTLPKEFAEKVNSSIIAQALRVFEGRSHVGYSKVKTRAEVNKTKKKMYKQKGTGGARHGSRRAPIFVGGGIAHGPKLEKRTFILPKNIIRIARKSVLSLKASQGEVVIAQGLEKIIQTKEVLPLLKAVGLKRCTFLLSEKSSGANKALRNLKNVEILNYKDASALDLFRGGILIVDQNVFEPHKSLAGSRKLSALHPRGVSLRGKTRRVVKK